MTTETSALQIEAGGRTWKLNRLSMADLLKIEAAAQATPSPLDKAMALIEKHKLKAEASAKLIDEASAASLDWGGVGTPGFVRFLRGPAGIMLALSLSLRAANSLTEAEAQTLVESIDLATMEAIADKLNS